MPARKIDPSKFPPSIRKILEDHEPLLKAGPVVLRAELARRGLDEFARLMLQLEPARHHQLVNSKLEAVERGEIKRLFIFAPPGHAKSTYGSWLFPAWYLGRHPRNNLILATHTLQFSERWGRKIRNLFPLPEWPFSRARGFQEDVRVADDSAAAGQWGTNLGGEFFGVGVGGAVTGRRAHGVIIDDPIKGREDADSEATRDKLWEWYKADLHTRLLPDAWIVGYWTRWHEDDPAGRILPEGFAGKSGVYKGSDGETWEVLSLPALAEENDALGRNVGEPLWPGMFSDVMLAAEKELQGERNWSALYQQRPSPEQGDYFQRDWFKFYGVMPNVATMKIYGASDYAVTKGGGDYTVHGVCGVDQNDDLYILDWWRGQVDSFEAVNQWANMVSKWRPITWAEDKAQIEKTLGPVINKRQRELGVYVHREQMSVWRADKEARAQAIRGRASQGKVYIPSNASWVSDFLSELLVFPNGKNDDQVDVAGLMGRMLGDMRAPRQNQHRQTQTHTSMRYLRR